MKRISHVSDSENEEEEILNPKRVRISDTVADEPAFQAGEDGFVEGSIMKIALTNFVTYDYCEIYPGPQMNMIIGPNGTGKSTIVCAIALGLGGSPNLLGRQKNIAEFVKTGEDEAVIKITLKKLQGANVTIERYITKSNNQTSWKLNGRGSTLRDVMKIIHGFNIQVDNLCQFLPQDRVSEFAELTPSQLLEKTQAAAGEMELYVMQQKLIDLRNKEKELIKTHESDSTHIKDLNNRNAELERDVIKMREREKILKKIQLLKAQIPMARFADAKKKHDDLKANVQKKKEFVIATKNAIAPIQNRVKEYEDIAKDFNQRKIAKTTAAKQHQDACTRLQNSIKEIRNTISNNKDDIKRIKDKQPERQRRIDGLEDKIQKLEELISNPGDTDTTQLEEKITEINNEYEESEVQKNELVNRLRQVKRQKSDLESKNRSIETEVNNLQNVTQARMRELERHHRDTFNACQWLKENRDIFQSRVYMPILLDINIKDPRYAAMFESALGGRNNSKIRTFICESKEDYKKFASIAIDQKKWRIAVAWPGEIPDSCMRKKLSNEELKARFNMDCYLLDVVQGSPYILKYLCSEHKINDIPVSLTQGNEEGLSRNFKKFAIGRNFYNVKGKDYGKGSRQTQVYTFGKATFLGDSIDKARHTQLKEEYQTNKMNMQQLEVEMKDISNRCEEKNRKISELKTAKEDVQAQKRDIQRKLNEIKKATLRVQTFKTELDREKAGPEQDARQIERLENEIQSNLDSQKQNMNRYTKALSKYVDLYTEANEIKLQAVQSTSQHDALRRHFREQSLALQQAQSFLESAKRQMALAEREVKVFMNQAKQASEDIPPELADEFSAIVTEWRENRITKTADELELLIEEETAKSEAIRFANPNAMTNYEKRKKEIENLEAKINEDKSALLTLREEIAEVRKQWEPRLELVVSKINDKFKTVFERLASAGEIQLSKNEDFDKWGIEIWVKFRDNEKLQLLTGHRQSGGERSVSTILYLMALQDLAKSPFRVVDEINQGMDPRNERKIHEQIVQGASKPGTSQYFLITPKLLPDLFYNERMKVLCIYNGEWLPTKVKPLSEYLAHARATAAN